jgi:hypothetical protein
MFYNLKYMYYYRKFPDIISYTKTEEAHSPSLIISYVFIIIATKIMSYLNIKGTMKFYSESIPCYIMLKNLYRILTIL